MVRSMALSVRPGDVIAAKYRLLHELGEGGMGVVFAAEHVALPLRVAIKFLLPAAHPSARARFEREARIVVKLRSEHVCRVLDVGTTPADEPFIVMEHLDGEDLADRIRRTGPLSPPGVVDLVLQACEALAEAHGYGVVHRDLKPSNLFVARRVDGSDVVKVLDFGISTAGDDAPAQKPLTASGAVLGSPRFMAPEQLVSAREVTPRTDVWGLAVVLHELLTGRAAFDGHTPAETFVSILQHPPAPLATLRPDLPPGLVAVIEGALAKEASQRPPNMGALALALRPFASPDTGPLVDRVVRLAMATGWSPETNPAWPPASPEPAGRGTVKMQNVPMPPMVAAETVAASATSSSPPSSASPPWSPTPLRVPGAASGVGPGTTSSSTPSRAGSSAPAWARRLGPWAFAFVVGLLGVAVGAYVLRPPPESRRTRNVKREERRRPKTPAPPPCPTLHCTDDKLDPSVPADPMARIPTLERFVERSLSVSDSEVVYVSLDQLVEGRFHPTQGIATYGIRYRDAGGNVGHVLAIVTAYQTFLKNFDSSQFERLRRQPCPFQTALTSAVEEGLDGRKPMKALTYTLSNQVLWQFSQDIDGKTKVAFVDETCHAHRSLMAWLMPSATATSSASPPPTR